MANKESTTSHSSTKTSYLHERGFFNNSPLIRWLLGIILLTTVALFIHFRDVSIPILDLNMPSSSYVVAQVDFEFYDDEATVLMRQAAVQDIADIWRINPKSSQDNIRQIEAYLAKEVSWREKGAELTVEDLYLTVETVETILQSLRFTDLRTLYKMNQLGFNRDLYLVYTPDPDAPQQAMPIEIWSFIRSRIKSSTPQTLNKALNIIQPLIIQSDWAFEKDEPTKRHLKKSAKKSAPKKFTLVNAGQRIIDKNEIVTPRHISMIQAMRQALRDKRQLLHPMTATGSLLISFILCFVSITYLKNRYQQTFNSNKHLTILVFVILFSMFIGKAYEVFILSSTTNLADFFRFPLFVPFAAILTASLLGSSLATLVTAFLIIVFTVALPVDRSDFLLTNTIPSFVAVLYAKKLRKRKDVFLISFKAWFACAVIILALHLYSSTFGDFSMAIDLLSSASFMILTAVLVLGLFPIIESVFKVLTNVTLAEYLDPNNPLIRRLTIEAPGTYQHSVVVGNLAELASIAIGANGLLCRAAALYHDIGKIPIAQYFVENQQGGMNIHQLLTPQESARVIISHVSEGVAMARSAGLPEKIIDIIKEHHGTTLVYYFYQQQKEKLKEGETIDEKQFRYSGPRPRSKESAIIMIADSLEAASRCLDNFTEKSLTNLLNKIVHHKLEDGQLDECQLTFEELTKIKKVLINGLLASGHSRIKYSTESEEQVAQDG